MGTSDSILRGAGQSTLPGKMFPEELVLKLADSSDKPVTDCAVVVESEPGSELSAQPQMIRSDAEGMVRLRVTTGNRLGDNYLRIIPKGAESMSLVCRFVIGIELLKGNREGGRSTSLRSGCGSPGRLRWSAGRGTRSLFRTCSGSGRRKCASLLYGNPN